MKQTLKRILGPVIIVATIIAFIWYLNTHPEAVEQIAQTPLWAVAAIMFLYFTTIVILAFVLSISLRYYDRRMEPQENFLLTAYSSLVNFFGPGQSGPGVRAVYLKLKHDVSIKQYVFVTLIYYAWYAVISGILVGVVVLEWWQIILGASAITTACVLFIRRHRAKQNSNTARLAKSTHFIKLTLILGLAVAVQIFVIALIYFIELRVIDSSISFMQALSYTGAANFALFVALTPGAIGFREAFLLFSESFHGISQQTVLAASVIDRALYIVFLGLLFLVVLSLHANKKLQIGKLQKAAKNATEPE